MSNEQASNDKTLKRWTAKRRVALVLEILQGETTVAVDTAEAPTDETKPAASEPFQDKLLVARIKRLIETFPTYSY